MRLVLLAVVLQIASAGPALAQRYVTTLAGNGIAGLIDANLLTSEFDHPIGVGVDATGFILVGDSWNHVIRRVDPTARTVITLAGTAATGLTDGPGFVAEFYAPSGVVVDSLGTTYVADTFNHAIRKVTRLGDVSTLAGSGVAGSADGVGTAASFSYPVGLALDPAGNLYVSDTDNQLIRMVTPAGVVTTLAGTGSYGDVDGPAASAQFYDPMGIAFDVASGAVMVVDSMNHKVKRILGGVVNTMAGTGARGYLDGPGLTAMFCEPRGLVLTTAGDMFVTDACNDRVRRISAGAWTVSTIAGDGTAGFRNGLALSARFDGPWEIAIDAAGVLYVADQNNHRIRRIRYVVPAPVPWDFGAVFLAGAVHAQWAPMPPQAGVKGFFVEFGSAPGLSDGGVVQVGAQTSVDFQAPPGTWHLRVRADAAQGVTGPSNSVIVTVPPQP